MRSVRHSAAVGVSVLGPVEVDGGSSLEPRDRAVLAVLAIRRGQVVSPAQFADALWGDSPPGSWPKQVQICIGRLRRVLGSAAIETTAGGYRLTLDDDDIDVRRFESLVERARVLRASGEPDRAAATLGRGLALWRGSPLEQLDGWLPARERGGPAGGAAPHAPRRTGSTPASTPATTARWRPRPRRW